MPVYFLFVLGFKEHSLMSSSLEHPLINIATGKRVRMEQTNESKSKTKYLFISCDVDVETAVTIRAVNALDKVLDQLTAGSDVI